MLLIASVGGGVTLALAWGGADVAIKPLPTTTTRPGGPGSVTEPAPNLGTVETPLGPLAVLPQPTEPDCLRLQSFPFATITDLDTKAWDGTEAGATVYGIDVEHESIDVMFTFDLGLYLIRDGKLVASLRPDDPEDSVKVAATLEALTARSEGSAAEGFVPVLLVAGGDPGGSIRARYPAVTNCTFDVAGRLPDGG